MDDFPVRPLRFDFKELEQSDPVWSRSNPFFSIFINALGVHVPYFERFLVATMRAYRGELEDDVLLKDVQKIIGQEAHHAFNFVNWTDAMCTHYPGLRRIDEAAQTNFSNALERDKRFKIGFTAGYETFTFLGGMIILNRYEELMGDADPNLRALWVWHQVEEVEHGSVAFDFYRAFYERHEWYRKWMVLYAFAHISKETFVAYREMIRPYNLKKRLSAWKFFTGFAFDLATAAIPVLKKSYHPRNHPICNDDQNQVAIAWRQYFDNGEDALRLTNNDITKMLAEAS